MLFPVEEVFTFNQHGRMLGGEESPHHFVFQSEAMFDTAFPAIESDSAKVPHPHFPEAPALSVGKILVPVSLHQTSQISLRYAAAFARLFNAEVLLLHVCEHQEYAQSEESSVEVPAEQMVQFEQIRQQIVPQSTFSMSEGDLISEIVRFAKDASADLIILSTHGYKGLAYSMKGSVAEKVMRYSSCPVLCVKNDDQHFLS